MAGTLRRFDSENPDHIEETMIQDQDVADTIVQGFGEDFVEMDTTELGTSELGSLDQGTAEHDFENMPTMTMAVESEISQPTEEHSFTSMIEPRKPLTRSTRERKNSSASAIVRSRVRQTLYLAGGISVGIAAFMSAVYLYKNDKLSGISKEVSELASQMTLPDVKIPENALESLYAMLNPPTTNSEAPAQKEPLSITVSDAQTAAVAPDPVTEAALNSDMIPSAPTQETNRVLEETTAGDSPIAISVSAADPRLAAAAIAAPTDATATTLQPENSVERASVAEPGNTKDYVDSKPVNISTRRFLHFKNSYRGYGSTFAEAPEAAEVSQSDISVPKLAPAGKGKRWVDSNSGAEWQSGWEIDKPEQNLKLGQTYMKYLKKHSPNSTDLEFKAIQNRPSNFLESVNKTGAGPSSATRYTK